MVITCLSDELSAFCHTCTIFATLGSIDYLSHQSGLLTVTNLSLKNKLLVCCDRQIDSLLVGLPYTVIIL